MSVITLGSLFDGIGGFVYAASLYGVKTLWASEIIPAAISVTRRHFPDMEHVGDITKLHGGELTPVHIITFGSPCQSFSIAGGRTGLEGKSGLFWEAIRIIREMREATNGKYPMFSVFENVPGILSANRGRDYKTVLEAFTETEIPMPPSGKWTNAGMVRGGRIDLAWVIHDAQYFGVAQRRRRLFAVCDFTGQRAAEILFKPKSLHWYFTQGGEARKGTAANAQGSADNAERTTAGGNNITSTLYAAYGTRWNGNAGAYSGDHFIAELAPVQSCLTPWDVQSRRIYEEQAIWPTLYGGEGGGHGYVAEEKAEGTAAAFLGGQGAEAGSIAYNEKVSPTLKSGASGSNMVPCVCKTQRNTAHSFDSLSSNSMKSKNPHSGCREVDVAMTIDTSAPCPSKNQGGIAVLQACESRLTRTPNARGAGADEGITKNALNVTVINDQGGDSLTIEKTELSPTLRSEAHGNLPIVSIQETYPINTQIATRHKALGKGTGFGIGENGDPAYTLQEAHSHAVAVGINGNVAGTLDASYYKGVGERCGVEREIVLCAATGQSNAEILNNLSVTLNCNCEQPIVCAATTQANTEICADLCPTITEAAGKSGSNKPYIALGANQNAEGSVRKRFIVRRLTPTECERLQGYGDGWTEHGHDGKPLSDTARYQALGNSVAIPCVAYVISGIVDELLIEMEV